MIDAPVLDNNERARNTALQGAHNQATNLNLAQIALVTSQIGSLLGLII